VRVYVVTLDVECQDCNSFPGGVNVVGIYDSKEKAEEAALDSYYSVEGFEVG